MSAIGLIECAPCGFCGSVGPSCEHGPCPGCGGDPKNHGRDLAAEQRADLEPILAREALVHAVAQLARRRRA